MKVMRRLLSSLLIFFLIYFIIPPIVEASDTEIDEEELNIQPNDSIVEEGSLNENSTEKDKTTDGGSSDLHNEENIELIENNEDLTETEIEVEEPADNSDLIQQESIKSNELETEELAVEQVKENTVKSSKENIIKVFSAETSTLSFPFKRGERHEKIVEIKKMLNHIGFGGISETTLFGSWMETRVKQFQSYYGLKVTGEINEKTYEKIKEVYDSPFQLGRRHDETPKLKEKLNRIGYGYITVTTLYGSFMDNRVRKFQRDHGLRVNGIMDEVTLNKLNELSRITFKPGERHPNIVDIKKMLNHIGFGGISETTLFGSWMETRVKQFQSYYGLKVTGEINEKTYEKIKEVYDSPFQLSRRHDETPKLKEKLNRIGYGNISVTTLYGSFMDNRVRKFQRDHGLVVNGIMDEVTLNKLYELSRLTFEPGDRHPNIIDIKKMLNRIGFGGISETTLFGSWMETRVRQLQEYYGLEVTGKVDEATYAKISEVFNSPFQLGKRHEKTPELKEKLNRIGYGNISVTTLYGSFMDNRVRKFQRDLGLRVNGIMDELTQRKLDEVVNNNPFQRGDRHEDIIEVKKKLNHIGFDGISETPLFGSWMETRVKQFQRYYGLPVSGKLDNATLKKLDEVYNSPFQRGKRHNDTIKLKEKLNEIGYGYISVTTLYGSFMEKQVKKFQRDYGLRVNGIIDEVTQKAIDRAYNNRSIKIFLDPGHGGHDPGAKAFNLNEKDVVLDIARETARYLTNNYKGVEVKLSRSTDKYLSLSERTNTANRWSADYYVSFHVNAGRGSGFETYIYNGKVSQETRKRQNDIHTYLAKKINIRDRGQKRANFHVLRETKMPAILLEYMFIDNSTENQLLKNKSYRKQLGRWTAEAIANSFNLKKK